MPNYINNKDFYAALVEYGKQEGEKVISPYICECFMLICNNLAKKPSYASYTFLDDMIGDAIENLVRAVGSFKPDRSTQAFAYFTEVAKKAFWRRIDKEKDQIYIKHKNIEQYYLHGRIEYSDGGELSDKVIREYEERQARKREKARK